MDEEEFRRTILCVFRTLLFTNLNKSILKKESTKNARGETFRVLKG